MYFFAIQVLKQGLDKFHDSHVYTITSPASTAKNVSVN